MNSLEFGLPWVLWALPAAYGFFVLARGSAAGLGARRGKFALAMRCAIFLSLVLALSDPRVSVLSSEKHVIWAIDVSDSVGEKALNAATAFVREAGLPAASQTKLVFAHDVVAAPDEEDESPPIQKNATRMARAAQFAMATFPPGSSRELVLFTDGVETSGTVRESLPDLVKAGVKIFTVPIDPLALPEVFVKSVDAPRQVRANEPFDVEVVLAANHQTEARLDIFQDGIKAGSRTLLLEEGETPVTVTQRFSDGGPVEISLLLSAPEDTASENNQAGTVVFVEGKAPILIVSADSSPELARALLPQGIEVEIRPPEGVPGDAGGLQKFDAVVLDQVPAERFSTAQQLALERYVRDEGGGLLMLGGPDSFGEGGYGGTPVGGLLPLMSEFEKQLEIPSLAIAAVIDRSGSMAGDKIQMAKAAAAAAVEILAPRDFAGVVVFDSSADWSPRISSAADSDSILREIGKIEAGGGTNLAGGLELAIQGMRTVPAKLKHVILLSDGISIPGPHEELAAELARQQISLSTVALGSDADEVLLERMARLGNGRYYFTDSPESIPQIFARETLMAGRPGFREEPFAPKVVRPAPFLAGIDFETAPFLLGHTLTKIQPGAELWLATEAGDPLLATWRAGLGKVAAFTSDARNVWASEWLGWDSFGSFWAQVLREIMRPESLREFPVELRQEEDRLHLTLETVDSLGRILPGVTAQALTTGPKNYREEITLEPTGPGLLEANWSAADPGVYQVTVQIQEPGAPPRSQRIGIASEIPKEYLFRATDLDLLEELASATGGKLSPTPQEVASSTASPQLSPLELWPWFASAALLLFLADVGIRKLRPARRVP